MSIEFFCNHCYQKVETPDATAGKKGRCPFCSEVVQIPTHSTAQGVSQQAPSPSAPAPAAKPIIDEAVTAHVAKQQATVRSQAAGSWQQSQQKKKEWGENTRESQIKAARAAREDSRRALSAPAVGLIVSAIFGFVSTGVFIFALALAVANVWLQQQFDPSFVGIYLFLILCNIAINTMMIIGANHMRLAKNYTLALAGAILALVPLPMNFVCAISTPFAIWSLATLSSRSHRGAFRRF